MADNIPIDPRLLADQAAVSDSPPAPGSASFVTPTTTADAPTFALTMAPVSSSARVRRSSFSPASTAASASAPAPNGPGTKSKGAMDSQVRREREAEVREVVKGQIDPDILEATEREVGTTPTGRLLSAVAMQRARDQAKTDNQPAGPDAAAARAEIAALKAEVAAVRAEADDLRKQLEAAKMEIEYQRIELNFTRGDFKILDNL